MKLAAFMVWTDGVGYARGVCEHCGNPQIFESRVPWTEEEARRVVESETCPICDRRTPRAAENSEFGIRNSESDPSTPLRSAQDDTEEREVRGNAGV